MSPCRRPTAATPLGNPDVAHQAHQCRRQEIPRIGGPLQAGRQEFGGAHVAVGRGVVGESERLGRGERHRHPVRQHWLLPWIALGVKVLDSDRNRVRFGVREVHFGIAESHTRAEAGQPTLVSTRVHALLA